MLIPCPECERKVSDRATACPDCGFPVREWLAEKAAAERARRLESSRELVGEVDCPTCKARGFVPVMEKDDNGEPRQMFMWCVECEHSGRVNQCRDAEGFYAVSFAALDAFLAGELADDAPGVHALGSEEITTFRYPQAGPRVDPEEE